jgi:hypothetical protein
MNGSGTAVRALRWASWAPSAEEPRPDISFTGERFHRRLSMLSRMAIRTLRDIMPVGGETKLYFVSFRGEVNRQFAINAMMTEGQVLPAAFSLSVFNTPPALASIALNLTAGYSAVYPAEGSFRDILPDVQAALNRAPGRLALAYADEELIPEYRALERGASGALAFAVLLCADAGAAVPEEAWENPARFLSVLERILPGKQA